MPQKGVLHINEGVWITANAPDRTPLSPLGGGGGPGYGGWGLSESLPRGTSPSRSKIGQELSWRKVFAEEQQAVEGGYADINAPLMAQLPAQIEAERTATEQQARDAGGTPADIAVRRQQLTIDRIQQQRQDYLATLPRAVGFYGAMPFYKRHDSFISRINDPGVFDHQDPQERAKHIWLTFDASMDAAYQLHLAAMKLQALSEQLPELALLADTAELAHQPLDLTNAIQRRTAQIQREQQLCFDCLPNFLQHQLAPAPAGPTPLPLILALSEHVDAAARLVESKRAEIPAFTDSNPAIAGPLSKPQVEALQHLVDDQRTGRAGPLWAEYHRAVSLNESIRYLQGFIAALNNLVQRTLEVEQLQVRHSAEQAAAQAERERLETLSQRTRYNTVPGTRGSLPAVIPIGAATFAIAEAAHTLLLGAISSAVIRLSAGVGITPHPLLAGVLAAAWPSTLGNADRRYLISTPLSSLSPPGGTDIATSALSSTSVDLPYLMAGAEDEDGVSLFVVPGGKPVGVRVATFDSERQVYSVALETPQRTLTWTPAAAPGSEIGSSTELPAAPPGFMVYTGSALNPVSNEIDGYPDLDLLDQDRLIVTFPADSGWPPILVVFRSPRYEPGVVTGTGSPSVGTWLGETTRGTGAATPTRIAEALRGLEFRDFDAFRAAFWKAVASVAELSQQFNATNIRLMKKGYAPKARDSDHYKSQTTFVLHHVTPISEGGAVYDIDNLRVVTPKAHNEIHYGPKQ